jgi:hypothetical protein
MPSQALNLLNAVKMPSITKQGVFIAFFNLETSNKNYSE